uniref:Uncharacterized protein n=1 Tax=Phenylobacterium glaciei TaxID=2803784 RepID=A0A974P6X1_9CAUL|nr:hypothetical protein JKL49_11225 [Phenylobacterium glaciei]
MTAAIASKVVSQRAEARAKAQGRPKSNFGLFADFALAFWIMAGTAFVFVVLNAYIASRTDPDVEGRTVAAVLDAQARFSGLLGWMKTAKLPLRIAAFTLLGARPSWP